MAPLLLFPAVVSRYGEAGFAAFVIGQSVGLALAVVSELGWSVVGPQAVPRMAADERPRFLGQSLLTRIAALMLGVPLAAALAFLAASAHQTDAAIIGAATALNALSPAWYLTGRNRPGLIFLSESLPRVVVTIASAVAVQSGAPLWLAGIASVTTPIVANVVVRRVEGVEAVLSVDFIRSSFHRLRGHAILTVGRAVSVSYTSFLAAIIGFIAPLSVAGYGATDRVLRTGLNVLTGVPNRLQSWIGAADLTERKKRSRQALLINSCLGALAGLVFFAVAPIVSALLFVGEITIRTEAALIGALIAFVVCASRGFGLSLVAEGKPRAIAVANVVAAIAGLTAVFVLTPLLGVEGALLSALIAEVAGVAVQAVALFAPPKRS